MAASSSTASPESDYGKLILSSAEYREHCDNITSFLVANPGSILLRHSQSKPGFLVIMRYDDNRKKVLQHISCTLNSIDKSINPQKIIFLDYDNKLKLMKLDFKSSFLLSLFHKSEAMNLKVSFTLSTADDDMLLVRKSHSQQGFLTVTYSKDKYMIGANTCESKRNWYVVLTPESPMIYPNKIELDKNSVTTINELAKLLEVVEQEKVLNNRVKIACRIADQSVYLTYGQVKTYQHQLLAAQFSSSYSQLILSQSRYTPFFSDEEKSSHPLQVLENLTDTQQLKSQ